MVDDDDNDNSYDDSYDDDNDDDDDDDDYSNNKRLMIIIRSVGCIFAEIIVHDPFFKGENIYYFYCRCCMTKNN